MSVLTNLSSGSALSYQGAGHHLPLSRSLWVAVPGHRCRKAGNSLGLGPHESLLMPQQSLLLKPLQRSGKFYLTARFALSFVPLLALIVVLLWPSQPVAIEPHEISRQTLSAFTAPIPNQSGLFVSYAGDSSTSPERSNLELFEDGTPLGPAHSLHADVRQN